MMRHEIAFVQFVEHNVWTLVWCEVFVDPHFVHGNKRIDKSVTTFGEIDIKKISDDVAAHNPDSEFASAVLA